MHFIFRARQLAAICTVVLVAVLAGCGSVPQALKPVEPVSVRPGPAKPSPASPPATAKPSDPTPVLPPAGSGRGGYYLDDGPGEKPPENLLATPDAEPRIEPYSTRANRPYAVFGKTYTPVTDNRPLKQRGVGSWYGKKFHGQKTSSGEPYDMYKMTAAHPILPIPSYARVTNLNNGVQVIVRVNDRGPFHSSRIIDLSYTAALKLGYLGKGSSQLEVERLLPEDIERIIAGNRAPRAEPVAEAAQPAQPTRLAMAAALTLPVASQPPEAETVDKGTPSVAPENAGELKEILAAFSTSAAAPAEKVSPMVEGAAGNGFYLQLGAYGQAGNAESARAQLLQNWSGKIPPIQVVQTGSLYRVYSGPFASRTDAAAVAQQIQEAGTVRPAIVMR